MILYFVSLAHRFHSKTLSRMYWITSAVKTGAWTQFTILTWCSTLRHHSTGTLVNPWREKKTSLDLTVNYSPMLDFCFSRKTAPSSTLQYQGNLISVFPVCQHLSYSKVILIGTYLFHVCASVCNTYFTLKSFKLCQKLKLITIVKNINIEVHVANTSYSGG